MSIIVQVDSRENKNCEVINYFEKIGQKYFVSKVAGADYINFKSPKVAIDLKGGLLELCNNLTWEHERFKREMDLVKNSMECDMVILIREPLKSLEDVKNWKSKRTQVQGEQLYKIMKTMQERYNLMYIFCTREEAGAKILEIIKWYEDNL